MKQVYVSVQQGARKNYIGIVSDMSEEERVVLSVWRSQSHAMTDLVVRLAAALWLLAGRRWRA